MRYSLIRTMDINNGPGICASLYVQGCSHHCKDCFNPETWDFKGGYLWTDKVRNRFLNACEEEHIKNVCILGGEPLDQGKELFNLLLEITKPVWLWTGYTWEEIFNVKENGVVSQQSLDEKRLLMSGIVMLCDVIVDGPFKTELQDKSLKYRGSSNQRVIDVKKSLEKNRIVLYEGAY